MIGLWALPFLAGASTITEQKLSERLVGTYTNEEQAYFEKDAGREAPPWMSLKIEQQDDQMVLTEIDAFGAQTAAGKAVSVSAGKQRDVLTVGGCSRFMDKTALGWKYSQIQNRNLCQQSYQIIAVDNDAVTLRLGDGTETVLKRARPVQCWAAVPKRQPKEDGSTNWLFIQKLDLHDQGGRVIVGGADSGAEEVTLRMRAVHWPPPSTSRPSMVLYIHKEDPDRAASYSWADINASRVGINLRWMQASCTISGAERASEVNRGNFRG